MSKLNVCIIVFPGSNCDDDVVFALSSLKNVTIKKIWHAEGSIRNCNLIILPGGFSYGDYLRSGSVASKSLIMNDVIRFSREGRPVLGICNGFQILLESQLLKGALLRNRQHRFACKPVHVRVENTDSVFTSSYIEKEVLNIPIAHGEGNYFAPPEIIQELEDKDLIAFRHVNSKGVAADDINPNGSINNIAGIFNENKNILGLMPHPERASDIEIKKTDGLGIFKSLLSRVAEL